MSFPDEAFRHAPELKGRIKDPETSYFRPVRERLAEWDAAAEAQGRADWRLSDEAREATRRKALAGREGDVWVFAYGSLIWDPAIHVAEIRRARLDGWRRSFCFETEGGRGSPENPGLMAALDDDPGHACEGVALRIAAEIVERETEILWSREMVTGIYAPRFMPVETPQGPIEALAFLADHSHPRHVGDLPRPERAKMIAVAEGMLGTNLEYLENLLSHLEALGLHDPEMAELHDMVMVERAATAER